MSAPERSTRPAPAPPVIGALTLMVLAASSVSVEPLDQVTALATVIVPVCAPVLPVFTVTLAVARAFWSVVVLMTELSTLAEKPLVFVPVEIVTLRGSSNSVPNPSWPLRSAEPE